MHADGTVLPDCPAARIACEVNQIMVGCQKIECRRCGRCCLADFTAYVTEEDIQRWKAEGRLDILRILEREQGVWQGDHLVSRETGRTLGGCPFFDVAGRQFGCAIYETRPVKCRNYEAGSSPLCPQFKRKQGGGS